MKPASYARCCLADYGPEAGSQCRTTVASGDSPSECWEVGTECHPAPGSRADSGTELRSCSCQTSCSQKFGGHPPHTAAPTEGAASSPAVHRDCEPAQGTSRSSLHRQETAMATPSRRDRYRTLVAPGKAGTIAVTLIACMLACALCTTPVTRPQHAWEPRTPPGSEFHLDRAGEPASAAPCKQPVTGMASPANPTSQK